MSIRAIDADFHVTGQITAAHVQDIAQLGYKTVICMRPDNEGPAQPAFADVQAAARAVGIEAVHIPVIPGAITEDQARALKTLLADRAGPTLAFCASGNRCASAYDMAKRLSS